MLKFFSGGKVGRRGSKLGEIRFSKRGVPYTMGMKVIRIQDEIL